MHFSLSAGEEIPDIQYKPESLQGMKENLEKILLFMAQRQIRMHQITAKEILEGNLRAVMRLILALAAHYKPQSVRSSIPFDQMTKNSPQANGKMKNFNPFFKILKLAQFFSLQDLPLNLSSMSQIP